jgi:hypothetical protein
MGLLPSAGTKPMPDKVFVDTDIPLYAKIDDGRSIPNLTIF